MRNLLHVNEGLVTFFHFLLFLSQISVTFIGLRFSNLPSHFPSHVWNYLFVIFALLFIRFVMHLSTQVKHVHFLISYRTSVKSSLTKYAVAVNFAVLFENISTTIKHTFYMIPAYRGTWLISYTANMAQKLEILINRLMHGKCNFHGFFK